MDRTLRDASTLGALVLVVGLGAEVAAQFAAAGPAASLALAVGGWGIAGLGIGLAYPRLSARPFDALPAHAALAVGTAVAFAEAVCTGLGSLLGGGVFSLATGAHVPPGRAVGSAFALLTVIAAACAVICRSARPKAAG